MSLCIHLQRNKLIHGLAEIMHRPHRRTCHHPISSLPYHCRLRQEQSISPKPPTWDRYGARDGHIRGASHLIRLLPLLLSTSLGLRPPSLVVDTLVVHPSSPPSRRHTTPITSLTVHYLPGSTIPSLARHFSTLDGSGLPSVVPLILGQLSFYPLLTFDPPRHYALRRLLQSFLITTATAYSTLDSMKTRPRPLEHCGTRTLVIEVHIPERSMRREQTIPT